MTDSVAILTAAFLKALENFDVFLALGLSAAVSAQILDQRLAPRMEAAIKVATGKATPDDQALLDLPSCEKLVEVPGTFITVTLPTAKWLLVGIAFVAGLLAYTTSLSAVLAAEELSNRSDLLGVLCLNPSILTAPVELRVFAALLPAVFIAIVGWREGSRLVKLLPHEKTAPYILAIVSISPYVLVAMKLISLKC